MNNTLSPSFDNCCGVFWGFRQTVRLANFYERLGVDPLGVGVGVPQVKLALRFQWAH